MRGREGGPGSWTLGAIHPLSCLQTKWNLRGFQAEKHPGEGASESPFFLIPHPTWNPSSEDYLLKFIRVAAFHPSYLYSVHTPPFSPCIVLPSSPPFLSSLYIKVADFVLVFSCSYFFPPSVVFLFS